MVEHVIPVDAGVQWNPNIEAGRLTISEAGWAKLGLLAHPDDDDKRPIVFDWQGCKLATMEPPNDEAIAGHRLYGSGLRELLWLGEVLDSALIADLERQNRVHDRHDPLRYATLRHWILRLKGRVVEVVAQSCQIYRRSN